MSWPGFCVACGHRIDLDAVRAYRDPGRAYVHGCGRALLQLRKDERPRPVEAKGVLLHGKEAPNEYRT